MAFDISYTYKILDKYTKPLENIIKQTEKFKKKLEEVKGLLKVLDAGGATHFRNIREDAVKATRSISKLNQQISKTGKTRADLGLSGAVIGGGVGERAPSRKQGRARQVAGKFSRKMLNIQSAMGGVAAFTGGKTMFSNFLNYQKETNRLASLSLTGAEKMAELKSKAKFLGKTTMKTVSEVLEGMSSLIQAGLSPDKVLKTIKDSIRLSIAGGITIEEAGNIGTSVMYQYGLKAKDLVRINDLLGIAQSKAKFNILELGKALKNSGASAKIAGIDLEELTAILSVLAKSSDVGLRAGTRLRTLFQRIIAPDMRGAKLYVAAGIKMQKYIDAKGHILDFPGYIDAISKAQKSGALNAVALKHLFGSKPWDIMNFLMSQGASEIKRFTKLYNNAGGTIERMIVLMKEGLPGATAEFLSALEAVNIALFEKTGFDKWIEIKLKGLTVGLRNLSGSNKELLKTIFMVIAGLAILTPILIFVGLLGAAIASITLIFTTIQAIVMWVVGAIGILATFLAGSGLLIPLLLLLLVAVLDDISGGKLSGFIKELHLIDNIGMIILNTWEKIKEIIHDIQTIGFFNTLDKMLLGSLKANGLTFPQNTTGAKINPISPQKGQWNNSISGNINISVDEPLKVSTKEFYYNKQALGANMAGG